MELSWVGALVTFQVTFTELFIAATVIACIAYKNGWRSAVIGSSLGVAAIVIIAFALGSLATHIPIHILDWVSATLLLGFGLFLYSFAGKPGVSPAPEFAPEFSMPLARPVNVTGVTVAAWGVFAEGLEIMIVWLGVSLKEGMAVASMGVLIGLIVVGVLALTLGRVGIFEKLPPRYLDCLAGTMVTAYGIYFLYEAITGTAAALP